MRNTADSRADVERFIRRVAESDAVWYLGAQEGTAACPSNEFEFEDGRPAPVLLFFSDRAYAERARTRRFARHELRQMALFDFLFRWLPGMSGDGVLAGPNWTGELVGLELDPFELREAINAALDDAHRERHAAMYRELTGATATDAP